MKKNIIYLVLIIFFLPIIVSCSDEKKNKTENPDIVISENQSISQSEDKLILDMLYNADISEETVDMITDIDYWEKLGLSKDDIRYTCLKAFIEGDTAKLAEINDKSLPIEAYNIYKTVEISEYTITYQENPNNSSCITSKY